MLNILPIKSVREEDKEIFGENVIKLARLAHHGLPVEDGIVVAAPVEKITHLFDLFKIYSRREFEENKEKFKNEFFEIPHYEGFDSELSGKTANPKEIWGSLLRVWFGIVESRVYREGFNKKHSLKLPGQIVLFAREIKASGRAYFDRLKNEVLVKMDSGELSFEEGIELDKAVTLAERVLHLPFVYSFIIDDSRLKLTRVTAFTGKEIFEIESVKTVNPKPKQKIKVNLNKRAVRLFLKIDKGFVTDSEVDGFIFEPNEKEDFDEKAFRFSELSFSYPALPVVYKFGRVSKSEDGSFRDSLEEDAKAFLFARHKKRLLNTQICLPPVNSIEQLMQAKRDLSSLGIIRKASLKVWMQVAYPENLIMLENYLTGGVDGVIVDIDALAGRLGGEDRGVNSVLIYALERFIEEPFKILHKLGIPVMVFGKLALDHQMLEKLVNMGVYAVIMDGDEAVNTRENITSFERSHRNLAS